MKVYVGDGRKTPKTKKTKPRKKDPPRLVESIKLADRFSGRKNRKQAGPTLGGAGILIYMGKRNKGSGAVLVDISR